MLTPMSNRTNTILLVLILAVGVAIVAMLATGARGGPLDPPGPPAPSQANLIYQPADCSGFPIVLASSGSYALAQNITMPALCAKNGIRISAANVSLDLRGFTVKGVGGALTGIYVDVYPGITVEHGGIRDWPGGGLYSGAVYSQFAHLQVLQNGPIGAPGNGQVQLASWSSLSDCLVTGGAPDALGILVSGQNVTVSGCVIADNADQGLKVTGFGAHITNNYAFDNSISSGCADIWISGPFAVVEENVAIRNINDTCPFFYDSGAAGSVIKRNTALGGTFNYQDAGCGSCDVGPIGSAAASTSPWANISE